MENPTSGEAMPDHPPVEALAPDHYHRDRTDPRAQARVVIAEATQVLTSRRAPLAEHVAAYRRRAQAWAELADTLPYDQQLTPTMRQAAADDHARARTLSSRTHDDHPRNARRHRPSDTAP
jgi:hypothetical protein